MRIKITKDDRMQDQGFPSSLVPGIVSIQNLRTHKHGVGLIYKIKVEQENRSTISLKISNRVLNYLPLPSLSNISKEALRSSISS